MEGTIPLFVVPIPGFVTDVVLDAPAVLELLGELVVPIGAEVALDGMAPPPVPPLPVAPPPVWAKADVAQRAPATMAATFAMPLLRIIRCLRLSKLTNRRLIGCVCAGWRLRHYPAKSTRFYGQTRL